MPILVRVSCLMVQTLVPTLVGSSSQTYSSSSSSHACWDFIADIVQALFAKLAGISLRCIAQGFSAHGFLGFHRRCIAQGFSALLAWISSHTYSSVFSAHALQFVFCPEINSLAVCRRFNCRCLVWL